MVNFRKIRADEFVTRNGKIVRKPKYDRCNKGHLLFYDSDREVWDCPICLRDMANIRGRKVKDTDLWEN